MKLSDLFKVIREDKDEDDVDPKGDNKPDPNAEDELPDSDQTPTPSDDETENKDEGTTDVEDADEDVGSVAEAQGFEKGSKEMYAFGKNRKVTTLTKNEPLGGIDLTIQYIINPQTGSWSMRACLAGQSEGDMVEFDTGEDPSSLIQSLKKKKKITPHQAAEYLNPPADQNIEKPDDESSEEPEEDTTE